MRKLLIFPACLMLLSLASCDSKPKTQQTASTPPPAASSASGEIGPGTEHGTIAVYVPAGLVGGDYWIYVDGHLAGGPPHDSIVSPSADAHLFPVPLMDGDKVVGNNGWQVWGPKGVVLESGHNDWVWNSFVDYYNSKPSDPLHIFQETDLPAPLGRHVVEVVYLSARDPSRGQEAWNSMLPSFPFVISQKYAVDVQAAQTASAYAAIPNNWSDSAFPGYSAPFCPATETPPDPKALESQYDSYSQDPMVVLLRRASQAPLKPSEHTATLDLPEAQGGPREFDANEVGHIVDAIVASNRFPSQDDVSRCANEHPMFASAYAGYGQTLALVANDLDSFRKFRDSLMAGQ